MIVMMAGIMIIVIQNHVSLLLPESCMNASLCLTVQLGAYWLHTGHLISLRSCPLHTSGIIRMSKTQGCKGMYTFFELGGLSIDLQLPL